MAVPRDPLDGLEGFDWDAANADKLWRRHRVTVFEAEEVFKMRPLFIADDPKHSAVERRFSVLGRTANGRPLNVIFTVRPPRLRVVSARPMNRKEREIYARANQKAP